MREVIVYPPTLYRYEDQKYIDSFFEKGQLKINSFTKYRSYADNQLGDEKEGMTDDHKVQVISPLINLNSTGRVYSGENYYSFCTSTMLHNSLLPVFKRDSVFVINKPFEFASSIADCIENATGLMHMSNCNYYLEGFPKNKVGTMAFKFEPSDKNIQPEQHIVLDLFGIDLLFLKSVEYQKQCEFRILWETDEKVDSELIINCQKAVQFCRTITKDELDRYSKLSNL